jgi:prepilin-type N-terminal cleavage/methylation domain-containing protein
MGLSNKIYCFKSVDGAMRRGTYPLNPEKGFTLIEVMAAVVILAIGIVGVLQAYAGSITTLEVGQFNINAVSLLKEKMADIERILLEEEEPPRSGSGSTDDFFWEWNMASTGIEDLNELTLTVSHKVNPRTFEINTYVVDRKKEEL